MATRPLRTFTVLPNLPPELQGLQELAYDLWWCWNHDAISLLRRIDEKAFDANEHSPVRLLASIGQERLEKLQEDEGLIVFIVLLFVCAPTCWIPWVVDSMKGDPDATE